MRYKVVKNFKALKTYYIAGQIIEDAKSEELCKRYDVPSFVREGILEAIKSDTELPISESNIAPNVKVFVNESKEVKTSKKKKE